MTGEHLIRIVDDDPSVRRALARLVRSCGFAVETFASADEYLSAASTDEVECVVLDIHLGGMSGIELRHRIHGEVVHPPVILITAHDDDATLESISQSGAPGYLRKPFDDSALIAAIGSAIGRQVDRPPS